MRKVLLLILTLLVVISSASVLAEDILPVEKPTGFFSFLNFQFALTPAPGFDFLKGFASGCDIDVARQARTDAYAYCNQYDSSKVTAEYCNNGIAAGYNCHYNNNVVAPTTVTCYDCNDGRISSHEFEGERAFASTVCSRQGMSNYIPECKLDVRVTCYTCESDGGTSSRTFTDSCGSGYSLRRPTDCKQPDVSVTCYQCNGGDLNTRISVNTCPTGYSQSRPVCEAPTPLTPPQIIDDQLIPPDAEDESNPGSKVEEPPTERISLLARFWDWLTSLFTT